MSGSAERRKKSSLVRNKRAVIKQIQNKEAEKIKKAYKGKREIKTKKEKKLMTLVKKRRNSN